MLVTGVAAGGAGAARSMDSFEDMGRVVDSAEDLESVSDLSRAGGHGQHGRRVGTRPFAGRFRHGDRAGQNRPS